MNSSPYQADNVLENTDNNELPANRSETGRFIKGMSGNPSGRSKAIISFKELARSHGEEALQTVINIMRSDKAKNADKLKAVEIILNRGFGLPTIAISGGMDENGDDKPLTIEHIARMLSGK
jgi:hypothetical protein